MATEEHSRGREGPPRDLPQTPPPPPSTEYLGWILQTISELHKTAGELSKSVETLTDQVRKHEEKLDRISHRIYAAVAVMTIVGGVLIWILNAASDEIISVVKEVLTRSGE